LAGFIGMKIATKSNVRTAEAAKNFFIKSAESVVHRRFRNGNGCCRISGFRFGSSLFNY
jgi:Inorganic H+ pyrophosphatase.